MKQCPRCKIEKDDSDFYSYKNNLSNRRLSSYCRECLCEKSREQYQLHLEERKIINKNYYENNKENCKKLQKEYENKNREYRNNYKNEWRKKRAAL